MRHLALVLLAAFLAMVLATGLASQVEADRVAEAGRVSGRRSPRGQRFLADRRVGFDTRRGGAKPTGFRGLLLLLLSGPFDKLALPR